MNRLISYHQLILLFLVLFLIPLSAKAQSELPEQRRIISGVEIFGGLGISFPDDKDWDSKVFNSSDGRRSYESNQGLGSIIGLGLFHSFTKRFALDGRFSIERRNYSEKYTEVDFFNGSYYESFFNQENKYLTFSIIPTYSFLKSHRLHVFFGISYLNLHASKENAKFYTNGQYDGGGTVNTLEGFEKGIIDALFGIGYWYPISRRFYGLVRVQGNYGLLSTIDQNDYEFSINGLSFILAIRYKK